MLAAVRAGLTPEIAAAVAKLMSNKDLVLAASKIRVVTRCRNTMGQRGVLGIRVQPNHPSDDLGGNPALGRRRPALRLRRRRDRRQPGRRVGRGRRAPSSAPSTA